MRNLKTMASYEETRTENNETGEVKETSTSKQFKAEAEPSYIKLYLEDIAYFHKLPKGIPNFIYELLPLTNYQHQIAITKYQKDVIAEKLNVSIGYIDNSLSKLVKEEILIRVGRGTYELNSYLFGKGSWKDIIKHRNSLKLEVFYQYKEGKAERKVSTAVVNDPMAAQAINNSSKPSKSKSKEA